MRCDFNLGEEVEVIVRGRVIGRSESVNREPDILVEGETPWGYRLRKWMPQSVAQRAAPDEPVGLPPFVTGDAEVDA